MTDPEDGRERATRMETAGDALWRALGHAGLPMLDPFLMLDEIHSDRREDWEAGAGRPGEFGHMAESG